MGNKAIKVFYTHSLNVTSNILMIDLLEILSSIKI